MTVNACLRGFAARVRELWPGKEVFVEDIPQDTAGKCLVRCVSQSEKKELGRRRKRVYELELLWFVQEKNTMAFHEWAERLYGAFDTLDADGRVVRCGKRTAADRGDGVWQFGFPVVLRPLTAETRETMEGLRMEETISAGRWRTAGAAELHGDERRRE